MGWRDAKTSPLHERGCNNGTAKGAIPRDFVLGQITFYSARSDKRVPQYQSELQSSPLKSIWYFAGTSFILCGVSSCAETKIFVGVLFEKMRGEGSLDRFEIDAHGIDVLLVRKTVSTCVSRFWGRRKPPGLHILFHESTPPAQRHSFVHISLLSQFLRGAFSWKVDCVVEILPCVYTEFCICR